MKMFGIFKIFLLTVCMCMSVTACTSDELIINDEGIVISGKKIVEMKESEGRVYDVTTHSFTYDNKERLTSIKNDKSDDIMIYTWKDDSIIQEYNEGRLNGKDTQIFMLKDDLIVDFLIKDYYASNNYNSDSYMFTFDSLKKLSLMKHYSSTVNSSEPTNLCSIANVFWENAKLLKMVYEDSYKNHVKEIMYSDKVCKGYLPCFFRFVEWDLDMLFFIHPELIGIRINTLPEKIVEKFGDYYEYVYEFSYTFDSDGYVESCIVEMTSYDVPEYKIDQKETYYYTFKWE